MTTVDTTPEPETMSVPMEPADSEASDGASNPSTIDDATHDLIIALAAKLEAIDAERVHAGDGDPALWRELATDDGRDAERLLNELKQRLSTRV